ncbi:MAG: aryl-sulfate sulfotransferase [Bacteroidetes bacterium]|nr:aryl-sulfate sulfotransferase [Bacteroidota bacterium]
MKEFRSNWRKGSLFLLLCIAMLSIQAQPVEKKDFKYISPLPGSSCILPGNNIALRHGDILNASSVKNFKIEVRGSKRGNIPGKTLLSDDQKTILFLPGEPFEWGERIFVTTGNEIKTEKGVEINPVSFWFDISKSLPDLAEDHSMMDEFQMIELLQKPHPLPRTITLKDNNLPEDFPELTVDYTNNPCESEYYFVAPFGYWGWFPDNVPYLIIFDYRGVPLFYQKMEGHPYDFKVQPNGNLSLYYNLWPTPAHIELDSSYQQIDTYTMGNGYGGTDFHELLLLPNGHAIVMTYDPQFVDMSQIVPGGHPNAIVKGWIIQELDADKNVVFQWRSWDHYDITDADEYVNLTDSLIDPIHGNSIELVGEDAMLLSPRNFNEITKIDRNTGEIIWRLGGENNMFDFVNDTLRFSRAHDVRLLQNGHISLFDNGTYHPEPQYSSVIEYDVDEENFEVSLVRRLRSDPDILGVIMGNAQQTSNGDFIAGWGSGVPGLTEFNPNNEIALEVYFAGINYRAFRFPWSTNYFTCQSDSLHFGYMWYEETRTKTVEVINPRDEPLILTSYHTGGPAYSVEDDFPVTVPPHESIGLTVTLSPDEPGTYKDVLTLNADFNTEELTRRIARQVKLIGYATQNQSVEDNRYAGIRIFPNPVTGSLTVTLEEPTETAQLVVYDNQGRRVKFISLSDQVHNSVDLSDLQPGLYNLQFLSAGGRVVYSSKIIKQ